MAIKVAGTTVIDDNRKFVAQRIRLTAYATENLPSAVEVMYSYDKHAKKLKVYDGSAGIMAIKVNGVTVIDDDRKGIFNKVSVVTIQQEREALGSLSEGELVYDTTAKKLFIYDGSLRLVSAVVVEMD